ncbi:MAG: hypothetical protein COU42_02115 [Candidatus Nealsonbacteria bacterium CG10_big_fil_rev_8_21_14_0_10_36_24]|uniref:PDGLE domain-containing protein n=2 Tax=Candidatus Nealsoniibacteriota TaxID=1817911 RepID=A0A2H0YNU7_9BACT|nr:MAG: hypothetical protein COU42_02115 [Candidatus Nealsonbacteria bacterium CG10_big_fil_rev_8_21_14_0_10_36_24]PIS40096.1 MAG: hypothetical protein COT32_01560 [Candidatus Nealsonbacteria bacterium CG08_land_8_20_14_0_20_36_22]
MSTQKYLIVIILCCLLGAYSVDADVMESQNYRLESDEINMGAIGEMRDFSKTDQNLPEGPIVIFTHKISVWEIMFGSALALLILVFVYYLVLKKRLSLK